MSKKRKNKLLILVPLVIILAILFYLLIIQLSNQNPYEQSIKLSGEWFLNNQNENFLYYEYLPYERTHSTSWHRLRETASLWAITRLANYLDDSRYTELSNKGFNYFESYLALDQEKDFIFLNITPESIKLGYSAFLILSLIEMDHQKKDYYLEKLANGIIYQQNSDGSFNTHFYSNELSSVDYYPGEALVALMSLYEYTGDSRYLETTEKAFPYYVDYWRGNKNTAFVPWQSRAYQKLYIANKNPEVAEFVFEMSDWLLEQHNPTYENCTGFDLSRGIVTAVYMEGVNKAYELAVELGDDKRAECYSRFVQEGADAILLLQVKDTYNFEKEAIGGFLGSATSENMRVDRNQHAAMALMEAIEAGILE